MLCRRTGGDAFRRCRKARLGKSFIKIKRQNVIPVGRYTEIGIWLPRSRTDNAEKLIFLEGMIPLDREGSDARLLPFLNHEADKQIALFALVVVFGLLLDLGIEKPVRLIKTEHRLRVGIDQPPAEASRCTEGAAENLQSASQQFGIEVLVPRDFYSQQFVAIAPLDPVCNDLFRAARRAMIRFHLMRFGRVIHFRVEIPQSFEPLANIAFPFFQEIRVNGSFLIDRNQFFQLPFGKLRARQGHLHKRSFRYIQVEKNRILRGIIVVAVHSGSPAQVPLLDQIFPDAVRPALQPGRRDLAARFHFQSREDFGIAIFRAVFQLDDSHACAGAGLYVYNNVHLMRLRVPNRFRGDFCLIQALFTKRLSQPLQRFVDGNLAVRLPKSELHRGRRRGLAGRRGETLDAHLVEKQILPHYEIQSHSIRYRRYNRF